MDDMNNLDTYSRTLNTQRQVNKIMSKYAFPEESLNSGRAIEVRCREVVGALAKSPEEIQRESIEASLKLQKELWESPLKGSIQNITQNVMRSNYRLEIYLMLLMTFICLCR